jgi:hypothetical protein
MSMSEYLPLHYQQMHELAKIAQTLNRLEDVMSQLQELQAAVAAQTTVIASSVALMDGLVVKLQAAAVAVSNGDGGAELTRVIHDVQANTAALAAAVATDTAASEETPHAVEVTPVPEDAPVVPDPIASAVEVTPAPDVPEHDPLAE